MQYKYFLNYGYSIVIVFISILSESSRDICSDCFALLFPNNASVKTIYICCVNCNEICIKQPFLRRYKNISVNQHFPETWLTYTPPKKTKQNKKQTKNNRIKINTINPEVVICRSCYTLNTLKNKQQYFHSIRGIWHLIPIPSLNTNAIKNLLSFLFHMLHVKESPLFEA